MSETSQQFTRHDVVEIAVGACVMAIQPGITEEAWATPHVMPAKDCN